MEVFSESTFASLSFPAAGESKPLVTEDITLIHVLSGNAEVETGGDPVPLGENDLYLINRNTVYELRVGEGSLCAALRLSGQRVLNLLGRMSVEFENGQERKNDASWLRLEGILWRIYECVLSAEPGARIQMLSLYYELANLLSTEWLKEETGQKTASEQEALRDAQILQFIHATYAESATLEMLAKKLYLSNAYLSKYIKKRFGMNYVNLVNTVRLTHAAEALKSSGDSITRIALSNGFSTVAAFNRSFREAHGVSPTEYRKTVREARQSEPGEEADGLTGELRERLEHGLEEYRKRELLSNSSVLLSAEIDTFEPGKRTLPHSWKKMINVGTAYNLTRSDYQQQLLYLHDRIGFEYVRFWDVFSPELRINLHTDPKSINFHTLFMIIDFLIDHDMKPFLELGTKPIRIQRSTASTVIDNHRKDNFASPEELRGFIEEFARQLVSRYGQREVSSWYFEFWKKDPVLLYADALNPDNTDIYLEQYLEAFDALCDGIRSAVPAARVGGGGFTYRSYGDEGIRDILGAWKTRRHLPDFLSVNCYCYRNEDRGDGKVHQLRYSDSGYINRTLADMKTAIRESGFPERPVFVTEFNFSVSNRNTVNDSCIKAAELMRLLLHTADSTEILSYWTALDAYAEYSDTTAVIFGGVGLLTRDGIPKPCYYVYDFLNRLDEEIMEVTEDYIISRQGPDSFKVVCHNFRGFTDEYYTVEQEDSIGIREIPSYIRDQREKHIRLTLRNIPNGKYQIRMREIDEHSGSVQGIWRRLNYDERLDREDIQFVRQMCIPSMWRMETEVFNGALEFEIKLAPNSIKYAHFVLKKG